MTNANDVYILYISTYTVYIRYCTFQVQGKGIIMIMERKQLKPWHGVVGFVIMMVIFCVIAIPVQGYLGLIGVGITELLLLGMALLAAKLTKQDFKEVFPIHRPKGREVFGTILCWFGIFLLAAVGNLVLSVLFTEQMEGTTENLNAVITDGSIWLSFIIVSLLPAICEEAVHRGFIQHTFRSVKREWITVLAMGLIFGIFHMDPMRFLGTAVLGAGLTWVMLKTKNMIYPCLFHGWNNLFALLANFAVTISSEMASDGQTEAVNEMVTQMLSGEKLYLISLGYYLLMAAVAPLLLVGGTALLKPKGEKMKTKYVVIALILGAALALAGIAILVCNFEVLLELSGISMEELGI